MLIKFAQFVAKRPTDRTIRLIHILGGLIILFLLYISWDRAIVDVPFAGPRSATTERYIEYGLLIVGILPFVRGWFSACLMNHKHTRITQAILGVLLIWIGGPILDPIVTTIATDNVPGQLNIGTITQETWHPGTYVVLLGIFWMLLGATGKGTTAVCLRYGEVIKKIRV